MSLAVGTRIGAFEITSLLGVGGMGEVYRATDTNLKRSVALKVLPDSVAADAERLARFQREAEVLASLNHPHIAALYGLERHGTTTALVMELVEGPTLADVIARRAGLQSRQGVPVDEAFLIARQIADALENAHEHGIVHRDLKPANIKVREDGTVKVLDFGLAKAIDAAGSRQQADGSLPRSQAPTITTPALMTGAGVILGTAAYMAPEQARGKTVDARADVWAFGCVLYEMLARTRAFAGDDITDVLAAVVRAEPDWTRLPDDLSPVVRTFLQRCLEKDVKRRLGAIHDMRLALDGAFDTAAPARQGVSASAWWQRPAWIAAAGVALIGVGSVAGFMVSRPSGATPAEAPIRLSLPLPEGIVFPDASGLLLAMSQDGRQVAFTGQDASGVRLYLRSLAAREARVLPGTEGAANPFFAPDGRAIGFFANTRLKTVALASGVVDDLAEAGLDRGGSWAEDDTIYFVPTGASGVWKVPAGGGEAVQVTRVDSQSGETDHRWPQVLPGGRLLVYSAVIDVSTDEGSVWVHVLATGERHPLARNASQAWHTASGHLLYSREETLLAVPSNLETRAVDEPRTLPLPDEAWTTTLGTNLTLSSSGAMAFIPSDPARRETDVVKVDRGGREIVLPGIPTGRYAYPSLSYDGARLAVEVRRGIPEVWMYQFEPPRFARLTSGTEGASESPIWTPDGTRVAYRGPGMGARNLWTTPVQGDRSEERLTNKANVSQRPLSYSPDGRLLLFSESGLRQDLWLRDADGTVRQWLATAASESQATFSPDGLWVAYKSNDSGRDEVYVRPLAAGGRPVQVSTGGGDEPAWSRGGRELFCLSDNSMMVVDVSTTPTMRTGEPRVLYSGRYARPNGPIRSYDVSPDGQWFVRVRPKGNDQPPRHIEVVLNWTEELKRLVPVQ